MIDIEKIPVLDRRKLVFSIPCPDCGAKQNSPCIHLGEFYCWKPPKSDESIFFFCQNRWIATRNLNLLEVLAAFGTVGPDVGVEAHVLGYDATAGPE